MRINSVCVFSKAGSCRKTTIFVMGWWSPLKHVFCREDVTSTITDTIICNWQQYGDINQQRANVASYYYGCNCDNMAHITQGVSTKTGTVKSELHISRASEEVTSPQQSLGHLSCSEPEQSSARGYVKTRCQLYNVSTQLQSSKASRPLLPAPSMRSSD